MSFMTDRLWVILGGLGGLAAILGLIYAIMTAQEKQVKGLSVTAVSLQRLFDNDLEKNGKKVSVFINKEEIERFAIVDYLIKNTGNVTIEKSDFQTSLHIILPFIDKVYYSTIKNSNRQGLTPILSSDDQSVSVNPLLLNAGDSFTISVGVSMITTNLSWIDDFGLYSAEVPTRISGISAINSNSQIDRQFRNPSILPFSFLTTFILLPCLLILLSAVIYAIGFRRSKSEATD